VSGGGDLHPNALLVKRFYQAFARRDGVAMAACYTANARFSDPVFPALTGAQIGAMWRMLCQRAADLEVTCSAIVADDARGRARWEARYTFSATGRRVHNVIDADFVFDAGLIAVHTDRFDFWRWSRMALGAAGVLLGWTPRVRRKVQAQARAGLDAFAGGDGGKR